MPINRIAAAFVILIASAVAVSAQNLARAAAFQDWSVYAYDGPGGRICYAASQATTKLPAGVNRDEEYFMVATWPDQAPTAVLNEPSIIMGYPLELNAPVTVTIGTEVFTFFTREPWADTAWIRDIGQQQALIAAMRRGVTMTVSGRSQRGTETTDTYSLRGITAALDRTAQECR